MPTAVRQWMKPLRRTPLHPQWLVLAAEARTRRWLLGKAGGDVLDVGCADGWARRALPHARYVGLDFPPTATRLYRSAPDVFGDAARLPFAAARFDCVLLLEVLEHVADARATLAEVARVLKPGGKLLFSMPFLYPLHDAPHDYRRYTEPGLRAAMTGAGLAVEALRASNAGIEAASALAAIACAEYVLNAARHARARLVFAPILLAAVPVINLAGWCLARLGGRSARLAGGYALIATKPQ